MSNLDSKEYMKRYMRDYMKDKVTVSIPIVLRNRFNKLKIGRETLVDVLTRAADAIDPDIKK